MSMSLPTQLRGIIPPLVTPLIDRDTLDAAGLEDLIEHLLAGGVHGLFILGTSGEAPNLSHRLRHEMVSRTCAVVAGRAPVLVGITDTSFVEATLLARHAHEAGAQALVCAPPFYFPNGQPELEIFTRRLLGEIRLPLFLYNMPQMTKVSFTFDTIQRLSDEPGIAGIKDSSGDLTYFKAILEVAKLRPDWSILIGPEHLLVDSLRLGGHGGIAGGANIYPRLFVELFDAVQRQDTAMVTALQYRLTHLGEIYRVGQHASAVIKGMKCALRELGICRDQMSDPFETFAPTERDRIRTILHGLDLPLVTHHST